MVARDGDLLVVNIPVHYPEWLNDLSEDEFRDTIAVAEGEAVKAFADQIYKAEQYWIARRAAHDAGQMSLDDFDA